MDWEILYLDSMETWLSDLDSKQFKSVAKELRLLELAGNTLKLPHSKSLGGGLFELRERTYALRIYYTFEKGAVILLLHAGDKHSQEKDIKKARMLMERYKKKEGALS